MKEILKKYRIKPSKKLGQNFLIDKSVLNKIIESAELSENDIVLEIGPGLGTLTIELAKRVKQVIAIEKDEKMCEILSEVLDVGNVKNVEIVNADILNAKYELPNTNYKLVANLPYYITSPVIRKFLETEQKPQLMVLMVQKEVAERIIAKNGKMSILSVAVQFYAVPEIVSYVSKKSFYPQPGVDSAIIKIVPRKSACPLRVAKQGGRALLSALVRDEFFELVKAGFSSKRKMLKNNLSRKLKIKSQKLKIVFEKIGIDLKIRAQDLSVEDWLKLYEKLKTYV